MSEQARNNETNAPAQNNEEAVTQRKLRSVIAVWIAFVILYMTTRSGNDAMMWLGLGVTAIAVIYLYTKN